MDSKKITLLANGCSHTSGSEIEFELQGFCYEKAWPRWLAHDMNWDWVNIAQPGNSNEQISRETIQWIVKNVEIGKNYKFDELVVIIMWSGFNRFEAWSSRDRKFTSVSGLSDISRQTPEFKELVKYRTMVEIPPAGEFKSLYYVYVTAKFLEGLGIKYYFLNGIDAFHRPELFEKLELLDSYLTMYHGYGEHRIKRHLGFSNRNLTFYQYLNSSSIQYSPYAKNGHYGEDGHIYWKDIVKDWIRKVDNV